MHGNTSCGPFAFITRIPCKHLQDHSTRLQYRIQAKPNHNPSRIRAVILSESKKLNTNQTTNQFGNTPHIGVRNKGNNRNHIPNKEHKGLHATCCRTCVSGQMTRLMFYLFICVLTKHRRDNGLLVVVHPDLCARAVNTRVTVLPVAACPDREHKGG